MQKSNAPTKLTVAFASGTGAGPVNTVPLTPGATPGPVSYQTGFTSVNMEPIASGGVPPFGADFNGVFKDETIARIWQQSGYTYAFDSGFASNANIGGYPAGSALLMGSGKGLWINQTDNNTASPDATGSAGWLGLPAAGSYTLSTTGGTKTPDPSLLGVTTILVTGTLTSNATVVLPLSAGSRWIIANNTTGSFTLTVKGATGAGVAITQGSALMVFTDGTAYFAASANISGAYLPIGGTAVAATKLATARSISLSGQAAGATTANFDGTGNVTINVTGLAPTQAEIDTGLGYVAADDAAVMHLAGTETVTGNKTFTATPTFAGILTNGTVTISATSGATPAKHLRSDGVNLRITNNADSAYIFTLDDAGDLTVPGALSAASATLSGALAAGTLGATSASLTGALTAASATISGLLTTGTFNATSSDRRLKRNVRKVDPRPLHRSTRFVSYTLRSNGWQGLGTIAQEVQTIAPEHVGTFEQDGKTYLSLNYAGMAYEQATWASREIDRLALQVAKLERSLPRMKSGPSKRGFVRRLLEAIW
jgi:hypothetical protein